MMLIVVQRQTANDLTGEHTCVMIRPLQDGNDPSWLGAFANDFHRRFLSLLSYKFREFPPALALTIEEAASASAKLDPSTAPVEINKTELDALLTPFDHKRLDSYASGMLDYHVALDLIPTIAQLYFTGRLRSGISLSRLNQAILLAIGLQRKDIETVGDELGVPYSQILAQFMHSMRKFNKHLSSLVTGAIAAEMPDPSKVGVSREDASGVHDDEVVDNKYVPLETRLEDELEEGGDEALSELRAKQRELIDSLPLDQ
jgi:N-acetyltransferase 10